MESGSSAKFLNNVHCLVSLSIRQRRVIRRNRSDERFKCHASFLVKPFQILEVIRNQSAPEAVIYICVRVDFRDFLFHNFCRCHSRFILERHVDNCSISTYCRGCCTVFVIFTPFITRIIQMCMSINCTREYITPFCIHSSGSFRFLSGKKNCRDFSVLHRYVPFINSLCSYNFSVLYQ